MDTFSFRLRFGNSTFAGANYHVSAPTYNPNYDCISEQPLQCSPTSVDAKTSAFAVFNMKYILEIPNRIPSVFCYQSIRMFDMDKSLIQQYQTSGDLPTEDLDLHLTEVGCIEYGGSNLEGSTKLPVTQVTLPSTTVLPEDCSCSIPPPIMTQSLFDMQYAFNIPQTEFKFGVPRFSYTVGCQHVSMTCPKSQKALMFFNDQYIINGNDILDIASKYNLHCDSGTSKWKFDSASEKKFMNLLGISSIELTHLGCASFAPKA
ncbi:hypothetical protein GCK72_018827 [Caenorhabditis remanei]|uniref:Uncharacterized protein n=1 Tax=Caenorhabditis remanei TaxID=31234 RepID=A0A6A5GC85_CAERE|nr:hypothetical protein GCK72_018827 [Caenorhabditis remanei]KAF1752273.1 hypothetical protein GCK72_018827 [Caenorhabditis remanei]